MSGIETAALVGAAGGALMDKDNPLRGAAIGGFGGQFMGPALTNMMGGSTPGLAGGNALNAIGAAGQGGGMNAASLGLEAAGAGTGAAATTAAATSPASMASQFANATAQGQIPASMANIGGGSALGSVPNASSTASMLDNPMARMGLQMMNKPQQQASAPVGAAPRLDPSAGGQFQGLDPYTEQMMKMRAMQGQITPTASLLG